MELDAREWRLVRRPQGVPSEDDFELARVRLQPPGAGEVLIVNDWVSVDPGARSRMDETGSYTTGLALGAPVTGRAVGRVEYSGDPRVREGATVHHFGGWRDRLVLNAGELEVLDVSAAPAQDWLDELGVPGFTAWLAVVELGRVNPGEVLYVSSAAGAVGSVAGQVARLVGAGRVLGSAGSEDKVRWLTDDLGFDAAFDYHHTGIAEALAQLAADGVDVVVDLVGGETFAEAFTRLRRGGRLISVGSTSGYNAERTPVGIDTHRLVTDRLRVQGFTVLEYEALRPRFVEQMTGWLAAGQLRTTKTVFDGLESVPTAFRALFDGSTRGKALVKIGPADA